MTSWTAEAGIHHTRTEGYDPKANGLAENAVGALKRGARALLQQGRLPSRWWGLAILETASAQRRVQLSLPGPAVPFGSRVVAVVRPKPGDDFASRATLATAFGQADDVPKAMHIYRNGRLETTGNIQAASPPAEAPK